MPLGTFLNGGTATQLRGLMWLSLSDTGQVGSKTASSDSGGGATESWSYGASVPCRVDPVLSGIETETVVGERLSDRATHVITTPAGTSVSIANRFLITGRGTFEVTAVRIRTADPVQIFEAVQVS